MTDGSFSKLRTQLDGGEHFVEGHGVIKTAGATRHAERMRRVPVWVLDDSKIEKFVNFIFPNDAERAELWRNVIYLYWRVGYTRGQVAAAVNSTDEAVAQILKRIKRILQGRQANNRKRIRGIRPRGRPKVKKMVTL